MTKMTTLSITESVNRIFLRIDSSVISVTLSSGHLSFSLLIFPFVIFLFIVLFHIRLKKGNRMWKKTIGR